jgi:hypothetical protein
VAAPTPKSPKNWGQPFLNRFLLKILEEKYIELLFD